MTILSPLSEKISRYQVSTFNTVKMSSNNKGKKLSKPEEFKFFFDFMKNLQCAGCGVIPRPDNPLIFQCLEQRHSYCQSCSHTLWICQEDCGSEILKNQCHLAELTRVTFRIPWFCKNFQHGCQAYFKQGHEADLQEHESRCRLVRCIDLKCQKRILAAHLTKHLVIKHKDFQQDPDVKDTNIFSISFKLPVPVRYNADNELIWNPIRLMTNIKDVSFYAVGKLTLTAFKFWIFCVGDQELAKNYDFRASCGGASYEGPCIYLDDIEYPGTQSVCVVDKNSEENGRLLFKVHVFDATKFKAPKAYA